MWNDSSLRRERYRMSKPCKFYVRMFKQFVEITRQLFYLDLKDEIHMYAAKKVATLLTFVLTKRTSS